DALIAALKAPSRIPAGLRDRLRVLVVNLAIAVKDARNANSAALLGYPLALRGLTEDVQKAAPRFVADVIEDQTGVRPDMSGFHPDVHLDGMDVKLTLNGVPADKLGSLSMSDLVAETTSRLKGYAKLVLTLAAYASETEDTLSYQAKLLDAFL